MNRVSTSAAQSKTQARSAPRRTAPRLAVMGAVDTAPLQHADTDEHYDALAKWIVTTRGILAKLEADCRTLEEANEDSSHPLAGIMDRRNLDALRSALGEAETAALNAMPKARTSALIPGPLVD